MRGWKHYTVTRNLQLHASRMQAGLEIYKKHPLIRFICYHNLQLWFGGILKKVCETCN